MANKYLDLTGLQTYDTSLKFYISEQQPFSKNNGGIQDGLSTTTGGQGLFAMGGANVSGQDSVGIGHLEVSGDGSLGINLSSPGDNTYTVSGPCAVAIGDGNQVAANCGFAFGKGNNIRVDGEHCFTIGEDNSINIAGRFQYVIGDTNRIVGISSGDNIYIYGANNYCAEGDSMVLGHGNDAEATSTYLFGKGLTNLSNGRMIIGYFNEDTTMLSSNEKIIFATGTDEQNRKTVMTMNTDGYAYFIKKPRMISDTDGSTLTFTTNQDLEAKVDKKYTGSGTYLYGYSVANGENTDFNPVVQNSIRSYAVPIRDGNGRLSTINPQGMNDCANKDYVDTNIEDTLDRVRQLESETANLTARVNNLSSDETFETVQTLGTVHSVPLNVEEFAEVSKVSGVSVKCDNYIKFSQDCDITYNGGENLRATINSDGSIFVEGIDMEFYPDTEAYITLNHYDVPALSPGSYYISKYSKGMNKIDTSWRLELRKGEVIDSVTIPDGLFTLEEGQYVSNITLIIKGSIESSSDVITIYPILCKFELSNAGISKLPYFKELKNSLIEIPNTEISEPVPYPIIFFTSFNLFNSDRYLYSGISSAEGSGSVALTYDSATKTLELNGTTGEGVQGIATLVDVSLNIPISDSVVLDVYHVSGTITGTLTNSIEVTFSGNDRSIYNSFGNSDIEIGETYKEEEVNWTDYIPATDKRFTRLVISAGSNVVFDHFKIQIALYNNEVTHDRSTFVPYEIKSAADINVNLGLNNIEPAELTKYFGDGLDANTSNELQVYDDQGTVHYNLNCIRINLNDESQNWFNNLNWSEYNNGAPAVAIPFGYIQFKTQLFPISTDCLCNRYNSVTKFGNPGIYIDLRQKRIVIFDPLLFCEPDGTLSPTDVIIERLKEKDIQFIFKCEHQHFNAGTGDLYYPTIPGGNILLQSNIDGEYAQLANISMTYQKKAGTQA